MRSAGCKRPAGVLNVGHSGLYMRVLCRKVNGASPPAALDSGRTLSPAEGVG